MLTTLPHTYLRRNTMTYHNKFRIIKYLPWLNLLKLSHLRHHRRLCLKHLLHQASLCCLTPPTWIISVNTSLFPVNQMSSFIRIRDIDVVCYNVDWALKRTVDTVQNKDLTGLLAGLSMDIVTGPSWTIWMFRYSPNTPSTKIHIYKAFITEKPPVFVP